MRHASPPRHHGQPLNPILAALRHACLGLALAAPATLPAPAHAQNPPQQDAKRVYDIPAGPLGTALSRFAGDAGVVLSFDAALTAGRESGGLRGRYGVDEGFARLLAGSGLEARAQGEGNYLLRRRTAAPAAGEATLATMTVVAHAAPSAAEDAATNYTVRRSSNATKLDLSIKETPQSLSIITEKQIAEQNLTTVADILDATPGITVNQYGPAGAGAAQYYARGYRINNMQVDGMPTGIGNAGGIDILAGMDSAIYERVETIRGSTGLTSGIGDPSASINFVRKRPTADAQRNLRLSYGRWDRQRAEADVSQPFNESGSLRGRVVAAYEEGDSWVDRVHNRNKLFYGVLEADPTDSTTLTLGGTYFFRRVDDAALHGAPLWPVSSSYSGVDFGRRFNTATNWSYSQQETRNFFLSLEHRFNDDWTLKASYQYTDIDTDRKYGILGATYGYDERTDRYYYVFNRVARESEIHNLDLYLSGNYPLFGRDAQVVVGANGYKSKMFDPIYYTTYNRYNPNWITLDQWNDGDMPLQPNFPTRPPEYPTQYSLENYLRYWNYWTEQYGGFLSTKFKPLEKATVILGTRYGVWKYELQDCPNDNTHASPPYQIGYDCGARRSAPQAEGEPWEVDGKFIPYAGLIYDITPRTAAYVSYTGIFQPHDVDGATYSFGNKMLKPKTGNTVELGIKSALRDDTLNLHAAVFRMKEKDIACQDHTDYRDESGRQIQPPNGGVWVTNCDGPEVKGVELSIAGKITPAWLINAGYTYLHAEASDSSLSSVGEDTAATNLPKHALKLFTSYRIDDRLTVGGGVNFKYKTELGTNRPWGYTDAWANALSQGSYTVVDLMARYAIDKHFTVGLNAGNIFDKVYRVNDRGSYYGAPRNVTLSLQATF